MTVLDYPFFIIESKDVFSQPTTNTLLSETFEVPWNLFWNYFAKEDVFFPIGALSFLTGVCTNDREAPDSCNMTCRDTDTMFSSSATLSNCLTLASLWQASTLYSNASGQAFVREIEGKLAEVYPFKLSEFDGRLVLEHIYECAQKSCQDDGADCDFSFDFAESILAGNTSMEGPFLDSSFCDGARGVPNLDIAGPGVSTNSLHHTPWASSWTDAQLLKGWC